MQAIRACVSATVRRDLKEPVAPVERSHEERVTFPWRRFLLLTYFVVTASTAQLCLMTQDEIRERKLREAQETRNRLRSANQEQQVASNYRSRSGSVQTTTNGRLDNEYFGLSASYRTESVSRECIPGVDDVSVMWSPLESKDGPGRHSGEDGADKRSTSTDTSLPRMCINDETTTDDKQNGDILRMQSDSLVQKSGAHISYYGITCFAVYALMFSSSVHGGAGDGIGLRFSGIGRELHNAECSSRISCNTTGATIPTGPASASFVLWHHGSGSTTSDRSNVSRQTAEGQGEEGSSDLARHNAEDLNNTGVLQSVRVWTDKTDVNADTWEAAIRHFSKVGVSSCFLMEIDKGCLQPSISDDSIFGEYIGSLVENAVGNWELAVKTNVSQNRCRVFRKSPWWKLSCDDDVWLREQATMNRAQNSFVDEQLEQIQSAHDDLRCYFEGYKTMQVRPATTYDLPDKSRICFWDLRDAPNCELEAIRQDVKNMKT